MKQDKVAILYQASAPPAVGSTKKPMKPGGYKDSGADIAFCLSSNSIPVATPRSSPSPIEDLDWVFSDTDEGVQAAYDAGARIFWLNTVLFKGHPIEKWFGRGLEFIGQTPAVTNAADDKFATNRKLREHGLNVADSILLSDATQNTLSFPLVLKPVRGRGSQGVFVITSQDELATKILEFKASGEYGSEFIAEEMLPGNEITITVIPDKGKFFALPAALRFNHINGIAPYNGVEAVTANSRALTEEELSQPEVQQIHRACEKAAAIVGASAPIRVDCRQDASGVYKIFDLNVKPNMTGAGRPGREAQDSLSAISARAIGWSYADLLLAMLASRWRA